MPCNFWKDKGLILNSQGSPKVNLWKHVLRTTCREDLQVKGVPVVLARTIALYSGEEHCKQIIINEIVFSRCYLRTPVPPLILSQDQTWPCFSLISGRDFFKGEGCNTLGVLTLVSALNMFNADYEPLHTLTCAFGCNRTKEETKFLLSVGNTIKTATFRNLNFKT